VIAAIALGAIALALGLTLPIVRVTKFYFLTGEYSLIAMVGALMSDGEIFLGLVIGAFTIVLPAAKLALLAAICWRRPGARAGGRADPWLDRVQAIGKWSMLDVFVLALVVFTIKAQSFAEATALPAVYFFAGAVALTAYAAWRLGRRGWP